MQISEIEQHIDALHNMLGAKGVVTGSDAAFYETGARYDRGKAAFVLRPATTGQASEAVAYCVRHGIHIIPQSANTGVVSGSTPDDSGHQAVISTDRLNINFELDLNNRSVRLDAGFRLSELNTRLEKHGLFFPIDLGADPRLGGMLATNTGGARFLKYGDVRRNTLGLTVVLADQHGTVLDLNSSLRKDNTGIDWKQIFIGTSGVFGLVTECSLNLEPVARQVATALLVPSSLDRVMPLLNAMEARLGSYLTAFEGMSRNAIAATFDHIPGLRNPFQHGQIPDYVILAEVTRTWEPRPGEQSLDDVLQGALAEIWETADAPLTDALVGHPHEIWALRHALPEGVRQLGTLVAFDISFRRGDLMAFCERMKTDVPARFQDVTVCDFGHIGDGASHFNLVAAKGSPLSQDPSFEPRMREWIYGIVVNDYGGSFSAEHALGRKNQAVYDRVTSAEMKALAAGLKRLLSPGAIGVPKLD